jgi:hypothetical protein
MRWMSSARAGMISHDNIVGLAQMPSGCGGVIGSSFRRSATRASRFKAFAKNA